MPLEPQTILFENLRESLNLYQRSLVWAMTASGTFFVLTLSIGDPKAPSVEIFYGRLSAPIAWCLTLGLFIVLGILAGSNLRNAERIVKEMRVKKEVLDVMLLYPSLATSANGLIRIGSVLFCPVTVWIAFGVQLSREVSSPAETNAWFWSGLALFLVLTVWPYVDIAVHLRHPVGSRSDREGRT